MISAWRRLTLGLTFFAAMAPLAQEAQLKSFFPEPTAPELKPFISTPTPKSTPSKAKSLPPFKPDVEISEEKLDDFEAFLSKQNDSEIIRDRLEKIRRSGRVETKPNGEITKTFTMTPEDVAYLNYKLFFPAEPHVRVRSPSPPPEVTPSPQDRSQDPKATITIYGGNSWRFKTNDPALREDLTYLNRQVQDEMEKLRQARSVDVTALSKNVEELNKLFPHLKPMFSGNGSPQPIRNVLPLLRKHVITNSDFKVRTINSQTQKWTKPVTMNLMSLKMCEGRSNILVRNKDHDSVRVPKKWQKRPIDRNQMSLIAKAFNKSSDFGTRQSLMMAVSMCTISAEVGEYIESKKKRENAKKYHGADKDMSLVQAGNELFSRRAIGNMLPTILDWNEQAQPAFLIDPINSALFKDTNPNLPLNLDVLLKFREEHPKKDKKGAIIPTRATLHEALLDNDQRFPTYAIYNKIMSNLACQNSWELKDQPDAETTCVSMNNQCYNHFGSHLWTSSRYTECMKDFVYLKEKEVVFNQGLVLAMEKAHLSGIEMAMKNRLPADISSPQAEHSKSEPDVTK